VGYESPIKDTPQTIISFLNSKQIVILMFWTEQETKQRTMRWLTLKQLAYDDLIISKNKQSIMSQTYNFFNCDRLKNVPGGIIWISFSSKYLRKSENINSASHLVTCNLKRVLCTRKFELKGMLHHKAHSPDVINHVNI